MPEAPEVEVLRRDLARALDRVRIVAAKVLSKKGVRDVLEGWMERALEGSMPGRAGRVGKYLVLGEVALHLGMSGQLLLRKEEPCPDPHLRAVLYLEDGRFLIFRDPRGFGGFRRWPVPTLGPDALGGGGLEPAYLASVLVGRRAPVKALLLDQRMVAGVGNIYSDEALFRAGIHPSRPAGALTREEVAALSASLLATMTRAVEAGGCTLPDGSYVRLDGLPGAFQAELAVYGREGLPCVRCGSRVEVARVGGRRSRFCPTCQL